MPPRVSELKVAGPAAQKLDARGISADEASSLCRTVLWWRGIPVQGSRGACF